MNPLWGLVPLLVAALYDAATEPMRNRRRLLSALPTMSRSDIPDGPLDDGFDWQ